MPGPIQSGISNLIGTAQVGGIVNKHFKEQAAAAAAEAKQAKTQNDIIEQSEAERTRLTQEEIERSRAEELAKDRQSELAALKSERRDLEPTSQGSKNAERLAVQRTALPESFDEYRRILDALGENLGVKYLYAKLRGDRDSMNALGAYANKSYYNDPQSQFRTANEYYEYRSKVRAAAGQRYYENAMNRVYEFTGSDAYKLRMMYATGKIGSRRELTDKLAELAARNDFKFKAYGGDK